MNTQLLKACALSTTLISTCAGAVGFGEIILHSKIGEPLHAEVPIFSSNGEPVDAACFSLAPLQGSDLPVITSAKIKLIREGRAFRLLLTSNKPIAEPLLVIGLRASCGIDLQRDYTIMPPPPFALPNVPTARPADLVRPQAVRKAGSYREWQAREGETLETIAGILAPDNIREQRKILSAIKRANPEIDPEQPLPVDFAVKIPNQKQRASAEIGQVTEPRATSNIATRPNPVAKKTTPPTQHSARSDRLVLGTSPTEFRPGEMATPPKGKISDTEERIIKMEATLSQLKQELEKLDTALALTTEILSTKEKIQIAKSRQSAQELASALPPPPSVAAQESNRSKWSELLISALLGGGIAAGLAQLLGKRRRLMAKKPTLLPFASHTDQLVAKASQEDAVQVKGLPPILQRGSNETPSQSAPEPNIPVEDDSYTLNLNGGKEIDLDENDSLLDLAEIMVSYGRVRDAAMTMAMHIEKNSPNNIQHWIKLLDLYRRGDMRDAFESLAIVICEKFNLNIQNWDNSTAPISGLKSLEDYPHIVLRITSSWATSDCLDYLFGLVHENRKGKRSGFPLEVVEEIVFLIHILEEGYGLKRLD